MGDSSGKKASGLLVKKKASDPMSRDTFNGINQNVQFCNRIGCSGRMNSTRGVPYGGPEKLKPLRPLFRSSSGKEMFGSCSRISSVQRNLRKPLKEPQNKPSVQSEMDSSVCTSGDHGIESGVRLNPKSSERSESTSNKRGTSSVESVTRKQCNLIKKPGFEKQCSLTSPSVSLVPKSTILKTNGLRNLRCNSMSDAVRPGSSSPELSQNRQKIAVAKKTSVGESSSLGKIKRIEPSVQLQSSSPKTGVSICDSRRYRSLSFSNGDSGTRKPVTGASRGRLSNQGNANHSSHNKPPTVIRQKAEPEASASSSVHQVASHQISSKNCTRVINSQTQLGSGTSGSSQSRVPAIFSQGLTHTPMNRDTFQRHNMNGIAEVLLALERIEQDEQLSYERLLVLETNLLLNGLNFHDRHRDMRLDIDNMSYEELLALEEKMGTVSTALAEDALEKCIRSSIYKTKPTEAHSSDTGVDNKSDNVKCSICQFAWYLGERLWHQLSGGEQDFGIPYPPPSQLMTSREHFSAWRHDMLIPRNGETLRMACQPSLWLEYWTHVSVGPTLPQVYKYRNVVGENPMVGRQLGLVASEYPGADTGSGALAYTQLPPLLPQYYSPHSLSLPGYPEPVTFERPPYPLPDYQSAAPEEYMEGDKLGRLQCEHNYHLTCAQQWLRLKNWCPVCKNPAAE